VFLGKGKWVDLAIVPPGEPADTVFGDAVTRLRKLDHMARAERRSTGNEDTATIPQETPQVFDERAGH
jgi:hypothetical protein